MAEAGFVLTKSPTPSPSHSHSQSTAGSGGLNKRKRGVDDQSGAMVGLHSSFGHAMDSGMMDEYEMEAGGNNGLAGRAINGQEYEEDDEEGNEEDGDDDAEEDEEEDDQEEEEDEEPDSMQQFSASRLEIPIRSGSLPMVPSPVVKLEAAAAEGIKEQNTGQVIPTQPTTVKEELNKPLLDAIQTSGAYCSREENLKKEEDTGRVRFLCYGNDGVDQHMIWLIGLKNIFSRQLPNMPKEYIVRLVMDRSHKSMMIIKANQVIGGITYRPYASQQFGEIAFCAITADEQVKGFGTRLMNHLKHYARDVDGLTHFLTYADNNAVGYFTKQGFTKEINLDKERWHGYIKDYDGGTLMECKIDPKLPYIDLPAMVRRQRQAIDEKIRELSNCHIVYPGLEIPKKDAGVPRRFLRVEDIPGLKEAGWTSEQMLSSKVRLNSTADGPPTRQSLHAFMRTLLKLIVDHADAWPFKEPVDAREVPDYYDVIKDPVDLKTVSRRLESELFYLTVEMFEADLRRMFANARVYNSPETIYYKCANRLEGFFLSKLQMGIQSNKHIA